MRFHRHPQKSRGERESVRGLRMISTGSALIATRVRSGARIHAQRWLCMAGGEEKLFCFPETDVWLCRLPSAHPPTRRSGHSFAGKGTRKEARLGCSYSRAGAEWGQ